VIPIGAALVAGALFVQAFYRLRSRGRADLAGWSRAALFWLGIAIALGALVDLAVDHGFHSVIGRIVGDHEASIALHARCGFEEVGREREVGRKFGRWLDVVLMQRML
jgi:RimJ/RimL family protein N-acetyltransferase